MAISARDLMIGIWVCYSAPNSYYTRVNGIESTSDGETWYIKGWRDNRDNMKTGGNESFVEDILHPIPITPEILEENQISGEVSGNRTTYWIDGRFTLVHFEDSDTYSHNGIKMTYVHELQNILRLSGIDKRIELQ